MAPVARSKVRRFGSAPGCDEKLGSLSALLLADEKPRHFDVEREWYDPLRPALARPKRPPDCGAWARTDRWVECMSGSLSTASAIVCAAIVSQSS